MINNLNSVLMEGSLAGDSEVRTSPKGIQVCVFTIATNRYYKLDTGFEKETYFFEVEVHGKLAEVCGTKGKEGSCVRAVGLLKQDRVSEDGSQSRIYILAEHVEFRPMKQDK